MSRAAGRQRVLVVEDEAVIRQAAVEMIREAGFEALQASNGTEAFGLLHDVEGIAAVLTDIDMPFGIDGIRLAACIHQRWPEIALVVTSGKLRPRRGDLPSRALFFAKPYDEGHVVDALRRLITGEDWAGDSATRSMR